MHFEDNLSVFFGSDSHIYDNKHHFTHCTIIKTRASFTGNKNAYMGGDHVFITLTPTPVGWWVDHSPMVETHRPFVALTSAFTGWDFAPRRTSPLPLLALSGVRIEPTTFRCGGQRSYHRARPEGPSGLAERLWWMPCGEGPRVRFPVRTPPPRDLRTRWLGLRLITEWSRVSTPC